MRLLRPILVIGIAILCFADCNAEEFEISQLTHLMSKGIDEVTEFMQANNYEVARDLKVGETQTIRYVLASGDEQVRLDTFFKDGLLSSLDYSFNGPKTSRKNSKWLRAGKYLLKSQGETTFYRNWTFLKNGGQVAVYSRTRKNLSEFEDFDSRSRYPHQEAKFKISLSSEVKGHENGRMHRVRRMIGDRCC